MKPASDPGHAAINLAYSISRQLGEATMIEAAAMAEKQRPLWWRWTTWLMVSLHIERIRRDRFNNEGAGSCPASIDS